MFPHGLRSIYCIETTRTLLQTSFSALGGPLQEEKGQFTRWPFFILPPSFPNITTLFPNTVTSLGMNAGTFVPSIQRIL